MAHVAAELTTTTEVCDQRFSSICAHNKYMQIVHHRLQVACQSSNSPVAGFQAGTISKQSDLHRFLFGLFFFFS